MYSKEGRLLAIAAISTADSYIPKQVEDLLMINSAILRHLSTALTSWPS